MTAPTLKKLPGWSLSLSLIAVLLPLVTGEVLRAQGNRSARTRIKAYLAARAARGDFSSAVVVVRGGSVIYRGAAGMAERELGVPLHPDHIFRIGSLTKPITATLILKLAERGVLSLSDSICRFVSRCSEEWSPVTLTHLLSHTSGIPDLFGDLRAVPVLETRAEIDRALAAAGDLKLRFPPGSRYEYSNFNYMLLGYAVEVATSKPWDQLLFSEVFGPLDMHDTRYDDVWAVVPRRVRGYTKTERGVVHVRYSDHAAFSAGGLRSTLDDLCKWHDAFIAGKIISKPAVERSLVPGLGNYGLGWQVTTQLGRPVHNHTGGIGGFASHLAFYPDEQLLVIVLSNIESEPVKATACDLAALALSVDPRPNADGAWLSRSTAERCANPPR